MNSPQDPINLANVGLMLLLSFCAAVIIAGVLVMRTRLWQTKSGTHRIAGKIMVICGTIVAFVTLLFLILNITRL